MFSSKEKLRMQVFNCHSIYHVWQALSLRDPLLKGILIINFPVDLEVLDHLKTCMVFDKVFSVRIGRYSWIWAYIFSFVFKILGGTKVVYFTSMHHSSFIANKFRFQAKKIILFNEGMLSTLYFYSEKKNPLFCKFRSLFALNYWNSKVTSVIVRSKEERDRLIVMMNALQRFDFIELSYELNKSIELVYKPFLPKIPRRACLLAPGLGDCVIFRSFLEKDGRRALSKRIYLKPHPRDLDPYTYNNIPVHVEMLNSFVPLEDFAQKYPFLEIITTSPTFLDEFTRVKIYKSKILDIHE